MSEALDQVAANMRYDGWGYVVSHEDTYRNLALLINERRGPISFFWTDERGSSFSVMMGIPLFANGEGLFGLHVAVPRNQTLIVGIHPGKTAAFPIGQEGFIVRPYYVAGKLFGDEPDRWDHEDNPTYVKMADLVGGTLMQLAMLRNPAVDLSVFEGLQVPAE